MNLKNLFTRALARPWAEVSDDDKKILTGLLKDVAKKGGPADAYRAVCTADYALF